MKNEILINKEKGWKRIKWANLRLWNKTTKLCAGNILFYAYVYSDKIRIVRVLFKNKEKSTDYITIKYLKGNFLASKNGGRVSKERGISPGSNSFTSVLNVFSVYYGKRKLTPVHLKRLEKIFKEWCESLGHRYSCSKNPTNVSLSLGKLVYPSIQRRDYQIVTFQAPTIKKVGSLLRRYLSLKEVIRKLIGSCGRKTYRLVCERIKENGLSFTLDKLWRFHQLFCLDDIQKVMGLPIWTAIPVNDGFRNRQVYLNSLNEYVLKFSKKALFSPHYNDFCIGNSFWDSIDMWIGLGKPEIQKEWTMKVAHDELAKMQRAIHDKPFDLNPPDWLIAVDGAVISQYTVRIPRLSSELREWGNTMNNCIAGYAKRMSTGDLYLLGIEEDGEIKYNIELKVRPTKQLKYREISDSEEKTLNIGFSAPPICECVQFVGKYNQRAEYSLIEKVFSKLSFPTQFSHLKPIPDNIEDEYEANFAPQPRIPHRILQANF